MTELRPRNQRWSNPRQNQKGESLAPQRVLSLKVEEKIYTMKNDWVKVTGWSSRQTIEFALERLFDKLSIAEARRMLSVAEAGVSASADNEIRAIFDELDGLSEDDGTLEGFRKKDFLTPQPLRGDDDLVKHASDHHQMMSSSFEDDRYSTTERGIPICDGTGIIGWAPPKL